MYKIYFAEIGQNLRFLRYSFYENYKKVPNQWFIEEKI